MSVVVQRMGRYIKDPLCAVGDYISVLDGITPADT